METVGGICTKFSGKIDPPGGRVLLHSSMVRNPRGTWHVPPRNLLQITASRGEACSNLSGSLWVKREIPPIPNLQVTCVLPPRAQYLSAVHL